MKEAMSYDDGKIAKSLVVALKDLEMQPDQISDAVFHMTDWLSDLAAWHSYCENPELLSVEEIQNLLMNFLVHVPNHVAAAGKIIAGIPVEDIFNVGATTESGD